jgi:succinate dehydrogenase flavin-adding protein (antitoxin of CptAB toxin-antitoxin module)
MINAYEPELDNLIDPYFVTLTRVTCDKSELNNRILEMEDAWRLIYLQTKKAKFKREHNNQPFKGIRKMECTVRPGGKFHFHYHVIIQGEEIAKHLLNQWTKRFTDSNWIAQDMRKADKGSYKELFKYFTKVTYKSKITNYRALDTVFKALRRKRVFQAFGGIKKASEEIEETLSTQEIDETLEDMFYKWNPYQNDWFGTQTGQALVDEEIPEALKKLFLEK